MRTAIILLAIVASSYAAPQVKPFHTIDFNSYWTLDQIYEYMDELDANYPDIVEIEMMGTTSEGREIRGLRITNEALLTEETPVIFLTAGLSARDWISTMSAVDVMHELTEHYNLFGELVDNVDWFIIPVANPDGYVFSFVDGNRDWIKNRNTNEGSSCIGVNVDRNFGYNWGLDLSSSSDPCSENYHGTEADSEEETRTIQFAIDLTSRLQVAYVTLKAGTATVGSAVAYPFSYSNEAFTDNFEEKYIVANLMAQSVYLRTGQRYQSGSESNISGFKSGTSGDYAAGADEIPLVFTIFMPRGGENGWDVPESRINAIVDEVFYAVEALGNHVLTRPHPA